MEGEVEFGKEILPPGLIRSELLLGGKVAHRHVISEDCEVRANEVVVSCPQAMDHGSHLFLMHRVSSLSVIEFLAFEYHRVTGL